MQYAPRVKHGATPARRAHRSLARAALAATCVAWVACVDQPRRLPVPGAASARDAAGDDDGPEVQLTSAGDEPRAVLRVSYHAGDVFETRFVMVLTDTVSTAGRAPRTFPTALGTVAVRFTVDHVQPGEATVFARVLSANPDEGGAHPERWADTIAAVRDRTWTLRVDDRGRVRRLVLQTEEPRDPRVRSFFLETARRFRLAFTPLPREPVGVGARWEVPLIEHQDGALLSERFTYRLAARQTDAATLALEDQASAAGGGARSSSAGEGAVAAAIGVWRPTRVALDSEGAVAITDATGTYDVRQVGRLEVGPTGARPVPPVATCADLARCCEAAGPLLATEQRTDCRGRVASGDGGACAEFVGNIHSAHALLGMALPEGCRTGHALPPPAARDAGR
jgi:hypothetical protein